jgi:hypothetical protein
MISSRITAALLALTTLGAVHAQTLQTGLTRDEVRAELRDAQRRGDVPAPGDFDRRPREITPDRYPAPPAGQALTRAQVVAELQQARRDGEVEVGETGRTAFEIAPRNFPERAVAQGKSREEVRHELAEATRTGDVVARGEIGGKLNELYPNQYARTSANFGRRLAKAPASGPVGQ